MGTLDTKPQNFQIQIPLIISVITGAVVLVIALLVFILSTHFKTDQAQAELKVGYLSQLLGERARAALLNTEAVLIKLDDILEILDPFAFGTSPNLIDDHMQKLLEKAPHLRALSVVDRHADMAYQSDDLSSTSLATRQYIQIHIQSMESRLFIGTPIQSEGDGQWVLPISRPSRAPEGQLERIVIAMIDLAVFAKQFENLNMTSFDSAALLTQSGQLLLPIPYNEAAIGSHVMSADQASRYANSENSILSPTDTDGSKLLVGYNKISDYGLLGMVRVDHTNIHRLGQIKIVLVAIGSLLVTVSGFWTARRLVRNHSELNKQRQKMEQLANTDMLTDLPNRFHFFSHAQQILALAIRYDDSMACFLLDIDHFKRINDRFGHDAGDQALCKVGDVIKSVIRDSDLACRFGGEEFAILLPRTDLEGALVVAERLLAGLRAVNFQRNDQTQTITASIGISVRNRNEIVNIDTLIKRADKALYLAKENGRDRVETCSSSASLPITPTKAPAPQARD